MTSIAVKVARDKDKHPENYCPFKGCLWRTGGGGYCPRHQVRFQGTEVEREPVRATIISHKEWE